MKWLGMSCLSIAAGLALSWTVSADVHAGTLRENGSSAEQVASRVYRGAGTVTRVVYDLGAVMIEHDPVPELGWPAMNMTFAVRGDALLQGIEPGDRIDFVFVKSGENYIITSIFQPLKGEPYEAH